MFKVLVLEDDIELQQLYCRVLSRNGYLPFGAAFAKEAFSIMAVSYTHLKRHFKLIHIPHLTLFFRESQTHFLLPSPKSAVLPLSLIHIYPRKCCFLSGLCRNGAKPGAKILPGIYSAYGELFDG